MNRLSKPKLWGAACSAALCLAWGAGAAEQGETLLAEPEQSPAWLEETPSGGVFDNLRLTVDLSSRAVYSEQLDDWGFTQFIGFDAHTVLSHAEGDWATLVLQGYLTRVDNVEPAPPIFDDGNDWEFVYRIFNLNYTALAQGRLNVRVGHYEVPFGLEHLVNTNGTLRQYIQPQNLGVKADWGVSVNGVLDRFEYEAGVTTGTGNDLRLNNGTFTVGARLGTPRDDTTVLGVSVFHGEVASASAPGGFVRRTRVGIDATHYVGVFGLMGEASVGRDFSADVVNMIGEINWTTPEEDVLVYGQIRYFSRRTDTWDNAAKVTLGLRWDLDGHWSLSTQCDVDLTTFGGAPRGGSVAFQVRYRF